MSALGRKRTLPARLPGDPAERPLSARSRHHREDRLRAAGAAGRASKGVPMNMSGTLKQTTLAA